MHALAPAMLAVVATFAPARSAAAGERIYQAFDNKFTTVDSQLDQLRELGFTAVQVSPPQKSPADPIWYARYQPIDFRVIEGPLGSEGELKNLIDHAHQRGLKIIVDVVLNHMADPKHVGGHLRFPEFSETDFHWPDGQHCIGNFHNRDEVTGYWLCDGNAHLPDLDTSSDYVRSVHKKYLKKLMDLGADGFRFDAVKHVEPEYWQDLVKVIPSGKFYYGEVIGESLWESNLYTGSMKVTDFHLLRTMLSAFSANGDMRFLTNPEAFGAALPGRDAVVFARNHDTAMHGDFFNFGDYQDALLANAYVLARGIGDVLIYREDGWKPLTRAALVFDRALRNDSPYVRNTADVCGDGCNPRTTLVLERSGHGVMIMNTKDTWLDVAAARMPGLDEGCFREAQYGFLVTVSKGGDGQKWISAWGSKARGGMNVGPRSALFLLKVGDSSCAF